jgi:DNA-binding NarL/FixJ family response regulator
MEDAQIEGRAYHDVLEEFDKKLIQQYLTAAGSWNAAADKMQISVRLLMYKIRRYGLVRSPRARFAATVKDISQVRITPRDREILDLLVQGCSNEDIAKELGIAARTVKSHLRTLYMRFGIEGEGQRVRLALAVSSPVVTEGTRTAPVSDLLTPREISIVECVCNGEINRDIGEEMGMSEQCVKNSLRVIFDKAGVWSRLELAAWYHARTAKGGPVPLTSRAGIAGYDGRDEPSLDELLAPVLR